DRAYLWRQGLKSPDMPRSEMHSPLLHRHGIDLRNTTSLPTSPMLGSHSVDTVNHIWAPAVTSPSQEFPRSPSPLINMHHSYLSTSQNQGHQPLFQSLSSPLSSLSSHPSNPHHRPTPLRHQLSNTPDLVDSLESHRYRSQQYDLDN